MVTREDVIGLVEGDEGVSCGDVVSLMRKEMDRGSQTAN